MNLSEFFIEDQRLDLSLGYASDHVLRKIEEFAGRPKGWRFGEGRSPTRETVQTAQSLAIEVINVGFKVLDAFMDVDGGISVTAYREKADRGYKHYVEFTVEESGKISAVREKDREIVDDRDDLSFDQTIKLLRKWRNAIFGMSESYRSVIGTETMRDSEAQLFNRQASMLASLLSVRSVQRNIQGPYAHTWNATTESISKNLTSGGEWTTPYSLLTQQTLIQYPV